MERSRTLEYNWTMADKVGESIFVSPSFRSFTFLFFSSFFFFFKYIFEQRPIHQGGLFQQEPDSQAMGPLSGHLVWVVRLLNLSFLQHQEYFSPTEPTCTVALVPKWSISMAICLLYGSEYLINTAQDFNFLGKFCSQTSLSYDVILQIQSGPPSLVSCIQNVKELLQCQVYP